jgi:hypothetical protein
MARTSCHHAPEHRPSIPATVQKPQVDRAVGRFNRGGPRPTLGAWWIIDRPIPAASWIIDRAIPAASWSAIRPIPAASWLVDP